MSTTSLSAVKDYLRVDHTLDDSSIQKLVDAAEAYIRSLCVPYVDEGGDESALPDELETAVMILASHWYENRALMSEKQAVELPFSVSALIANFRDWEGAADDT